jgi:predicted RNase H-like HicB family nuclease
MGWMRQKRLPDGSGACLNCVGWGKKYGLGLTLRSKGKRKMKSQTTPPAKIPTPNKDLAYYLSLPYSITLTPDEDGYWFAEIPLLEGCMTNGDSQTDALAMIEDAKRAWLTAALKLGLPIPEPERQPLR